MVESMSATARTCTPSRGRRVTIVCSWLASRVGGAGGGPGGAVADPDAVSGVGEVAKTDGLSWFGSDVP